MAENYYNPPAIEINGRKYRPAVIVPILRPGGDLLLGVRADAPAGEKLSDSHLQMPQGGLDEDEIDISNGETIYNIEAAGLREAMEELGLPKQHISPIGDLSALEPSTYLFESVPDFWIDQKTGTPIYDGQAVFICPVMQNEGINLLEKDDNGQYLYIDFDKNPDGKPEFKHVEWASWNTALDRVYGSKLEAYKHIIGQLAEQFPNIAKQQDFGQTRQGPKPTHIIGQTYDGTGPER